LNSSPARSSSRSTEATLALALRWILRAGIVIPPLVWLLERRAGVILPWDVFLLPCMALGFAVCAAVHASGRVASERVALAGILTLNVYLVSSLLAMLLWHPELSRSHQIASVLFWLPVSFVAAQLFLRPRVALLVCVASIVLCLAPSAVAWVLRVPAVAQWPADAVPLLANLGLALMAFTLVLNAVSHLKLRAVAAEQDVHAMEQLATTDALTGLANRRAMTLEIEAALALAQRSGQPIALAMIDIDHFKHINDRHGHAAGDAALVRCAQLLQGHLRAADRLGRWGGEEFVLVAPLTRVSACMELAERLRATVAASAFDHGAAVTLSIGLAGYQPGDGLSSLLARADQALYRAKTLGRNRVELQALAVPKQAA
jgi:diguanylate cyclase (GGDEF)-like protein